jgi:hypothetical protein
VALLQDELKIRKIHELLHMKLALPPYQRPYSWSVKSANTLFQDTYNAYHEYEKKDGASRRASAMGFGSGISTGLDRGPGGKITTGSQAI